MPLGQFAIILDNPSMSYFPGQMVTGRVVIVAHSEKKTQGVKLKFTGIAKVHWTEEKTETRGTGDDRREEKVTHSYDDSDCFFDFKSYLLGDGRSDVFLPPGESFYPFTFQLPFMNTPSSYVGQHGRVEYVLEANVNRSWKFDYNTKQYITVNALVDLNNDPAATTPVEQKTSKTFCCWCCASGPLTLTIRMPGRGYVPGEIIPLEVETNNLSTRTVNHVSAQMLQTASFFAEGKRNSATQSLFKEKSGHGDVAGGDSDVWRVECRVPPVPPSKLGGCRIIDVEYNLHIEAHVSGLAMNLSHKVPIVIGTVPLRANFERLQPTVSPPSAPPMFTPQGYSDLPIPQYQDSYNFNPDAPPANLVQNVTNTVIDNVVPPQPDYVPKYVTYGWNFSSFPPPPR